MESQFNKNVSMANSDRKKSWLIQSACLRRRIAISVILTGLVGPIPGLAMSPIYSEAYTLEELLRTGTQFVLIGTPQKLWNLPEGSYRESLELLERNKKLHEKKGGNSAYESYANEQFGNAGAIRSCERSEGPSSGCLFFLEFSVKRVAFTSPRAGFKLPSDTKTIYLALGTLSYTKDEMSTWQQTIGKDVVMLTTSKRENSNSSLLRIHQPVWANLQEKLPIPLADFPKVEKIARDLGFIEYQNNK